MIRVQCPQCQRRYRTRMEAFGRTAICSKCHQTFKIGESRPPFEWKSTDLGEDSWIGVEVPEQKAERKHCIICDAPLRPGDIRCPECSANQITGVVQRRKPKTDDREWSIGSYIPMRAILIFTVIGGIAAVSYLAILFIAQSATQTAEQLADDAILRDAAQYLREGGDESTFPERFGGRVNDTNLPRFVRRLSATDVGIRRATALLIGSSRITTLRPVVEWARESTDRPLVISVLGAFGARRLVEMGDIPGEEARKLSAQAMLLLCGQPLTEESVRSLTEATTPAQRIARYNDLCRPWPETVGRFQLIVDRTTAPFDVTVEQIGRMFYLKLGSKEFASDPAAQRAFSIPIEQYCAATGAAVSAGAVRDLMRGEVRLESSTGVGWEGLIQASMKRALDGPLPGFLPVAKPAPDGAISVPIRLERPNH